MKEIVLDILVYVGVGVGMAALAGGIRVAYGAASAWLKKQEAEATAAKKEVQARAFGLANETLGNIVKAVVGRIEQTKAADIREKVHAGELDYSQLEILATDAYYDILEQLKPDMQETLNSYVSDMEAYIRDQIEATLGQIKADLYGAAGAGTEPKAAIGFTAPAAE